MEKNKVKDLILLLLAIVFSIALMFSFIELPRWIDTLLQENVGFPGFDQGSGEQAAYYSNIYIKRLHLRWIGYGSLVLVCLFILMGFVTRKSSWAWAGAFVIFLPVFGQFALSMFFLSGLGIHRTGWLPFIPSMHMDITCLTMKKLKKQLLFSGKMYSAFQNQPMCMTALGKPMRMIRILKKQKRIMKLRLNMRVK